MLVPIPGSCTLGTSGKQVTGVPPWLMVFRRLPRGPLAVLKENWTGLRDMPLSLRQTTVEYLNELRQNLEIASSYATEHSKREQQRYISRYNLRAREKSFDVGEQVLILIPDSTSSKVFSRWQGPAKVIERKSPHSYIVELNGINRHIHVDKLRKYHISVQEISVKPLQSDAEINEAKVGHCAIIYDDDKDFGEVEVVNTSPTVSELLPSQKIDPDKLKHLSDQHKKELLSVLDKYLECFSDKPVLCTLVTHEINVTSDFKPKQLRTYRVPESLKPEVEKQIQEMLAMGIIRSSKSDMASPIVCVLKGENGKDGVRIAIDYRYLNKFCVGDAYPTPDIGDIIQRVGKARLITTCDLKGAYWQIPVKEDHQWLTAFLWDGGLYEFTRAPFGQKNSGQSFVRAIQKVLQPLKRCADSYVDDTAVFSDEWSQHMEDLESFLQAISRAGMTLNLKKCEFAKSRVKFVGQLIGSGQ